MQEIGRCFSNVHLVAPIQVKFGEVHSFVPNCSPIGAGMGVWDHETANYAKFLQNSRI